MLERGGRQTDEGEEQADSQEDPGPGGAPLFVAAPRQRLHREPETRIHQVQETVRLGVRFQIFPVFSPERRNRRFRLEDLVGLDHRPCSWFSIRAADGFVNSRWRTPRG